MTDPFKTARDHLAGARQHLAPARAAAGVVIMLQRVENELTPGHAEYLGDIRKAHADLYGLTIQLEQMVVQPIALAPNVRDAIESVIDAMKALGRLRK
jgi:hypothetical protein